MQVRQANERAGEAQAAQQAALDEMQALRHAASQQEELLAQVTSLRCALAEAQADVASREDELAASRSTLERQARLSSLPPLVCSHTTLERAARCQPPLPACMLLMQRAHSQHTAAAPARGLPNSPSALQMCCHVFICHSAQCMLRSLVQARTVAQHSMCLHP